MILSDRDITARIDAGDLKIWPAHPDALQLARIDLHLGSQFMAYRDLSRIAEIDPTDPDCPQMLPVVPDQDGSVLLMPQARGAPTSFMLGHTAETIHIPIDLTARVEVKSSLARRGLAGRVPGFVDALFEGQVTLELVNSSPVPIRLRPGMRIARLCLFQLASPATAGYGNAKRGSHYQGQTGVRVAATVGRELHLVDTQA